MSSWANRQIPRKRDLNQIPESLRPQIIARVNRPEVIASESYQEVSQNEIIINTRNNSLKKADIVTPITTRTNYVTKKIDILPSSSAIELQFDNKSYIFVVLRNIRSVRDNDLWISSYNSIRKYYTNKIIIIDDNSSLNTVDGKLFNAEVIRSEFPGAGEVLPYYYFLKYKWADRMIFLHDSMFIYRPFKDIELEGDIKFHWHFKSNGFDDYRKINNFISLLKNNKELQTFATNPDSIWKGCFGATTIADLKTIQYIEEEYGLFNSLTMTIKTRKDRETFERILGIVLYHKEMVDENKISNFGDIISYPGAFESNNNTMETASHIIRQRGYDTAIIKVWRGR
jgi:hypothetical protein